MYRISRADALEMLSRHDGYKIRVTNTYSFQIIIDNQCGERNTIVGWIVNDLFYEWLDKGIIELEGYNTDGRYYILKEDK